MDLSKFIGKNVRIDLTVQNYFYEGKVIEADANSITLKDRRGKIVSVHSDAILFIRESWP